MKKLTIKLIAISLIFGFVFVFLLLINEKIGRKIGTWEFRLIKNLLLSGSTRGFWGAAKSGITIGIVLLSPYFIFLDLENRITNIWNKFKK
jgi:hypothetical protein